MAHDSVKAAKRDELDDARVAMDRDKPLLHRIGKDAVLRVQLSLSEPVRRRKISVK